MAACDQNADERLAHASYHGIEDSPVQLKEGRWEGEPFVPGGASRPSVGLVKDFALRGDLNGDGLNESVVVLWQSSGGSGTFQHIAVMAEVDGSLENIATAPLGDRLQIRGGAIENHSIQLDVVQQGKNEPACCPGQLATRVWELDDETLTEQEAILTGTLSLSALEGREWILTRIGQNKVTLEDSVVSLNVAEGRVYGGSACNRYSAGIEYGPAAGEIRVGPTMGTRMACPEAQMKLESEYLDLLGRVSNFRFLAGKLVLTGDRDGDVLTLTFEGR